MNAFTDDYYELHDPRDYDPSVCAKEKERVPDEDADERPNEPDVDPDDDGINSPRDLKNEKRLRDKDRAGLL